MDLRISARRSIRTALRTVVAHVSLTPATWDTRQNVSVALGLIALIVQSYAKLMADLPIEDITSTGDSKRVKDEMLDRGCWT